MNRTWSFADAKTGLFVGSTFSGPVRSLEQNTREGWIAIQGNHDHLSKRVDLATAEVIDYQPPAPDADHEWNATLRRWVKRADVLQREVQHAQAQARIEELERRQARRVRELLAVSDPQLQAIEAEIAGLRTQLQG